KIANVPAYIRKQGNNRVHRETEKNDAIVPVQNKEYSAHESSNEKQIINNDKKWFQSSGRDNNAINQTAIRSSERNLKMGEKTNTNSQQAEMQKQNTSVRSDNPKPLHQTRNGNIKKSRSNNKKQHGRDQQPVPFNVMMSHNDKQHLRQSKKRNMVQKTSKSENHTEMVHITYHLLNDKMDNSSHDRLWVKNQQELLEKTLSYFNVDASVVNATQGPSVTRFEVQPALGVKVSKV